MIAAPSSCIVTWSGLSAVPTSDTVTWRWIVTSPVSSSTDASIAVQLNSKNAGRAAERVVRVGLLARLAEARDLAAEPAQAGYQHLADRNGLAAGQPDDAAVHDDLGLRDPVEPRRHRAELALDLAARGEHGVAHQDGRARRPTSAGRTARRRCRP